MAIMETVTIINKSGTVISTGKHLINIFRDAKEAYNEKKASLHAEHQARVKHRSSQRISQAREETQSEASSRHSKSSRRSHRRRREGDPEKASLPPLTEHNLFQIDEGSVVSSSGKTRKSTSHHGDRDSRSPKEGGVEYRSPYFENAGPSQISLVRRHTDFPTPLEFGPTETQLTRSTLPPSYHSHEPHRSSSVPDLHAQNDDNIDMNLAYGPIPHHSSLAPPEEVNQELLEQTMSKIDAILLEAHCVQHTASAMMTNLQANPEAMAAVALTLAELSNLLTKVSPGIIATLKAGSPAIFALLASPQFLIAGGLAFGVTVVMFGGYKIIKRMQAQAEANQMMGRMEEALVFTPEAFAHQAPDFGPEIELSSIDSWRRGIADLEAHSSGTSVEGELITPEAAKQNKERSHDRKTAGDGSVVSGRSRRTTKSDGRSTASRKTVPPPASHSGSKVAGSEAGASRRSEKRKKKVPLLIEATERESAKSSTSGLMVLFKKGKKGKEARESVLSLRPKTIEM